MAANPVTWPLPDELPKPSGKCIHDRILVLEDCIDCDALAKGVQLEDLDALAAVAVCTPSVDASDTLDVLADALLEKGLIEPSRYAPNFGRMVPGSHRYRKLEEKVTRRGRYHVRKAAWAWARERVGTNVYNSIFSNGDVVPPWLREPAEGQLARLRAEVERLLAIRPEHRLETASGDFLERYASIVFGIARQHFESYAAPSFASSYSETDEELRARCRAAMSSYLPSPGYLPGYGMLAREPIGYVMNTRFEGDTLFADVTVTPHWYVPRFEVEARFSGANRVPTGAANPGNDDETP